MKALISASLLAINIILLHQKVEGQLFEDYKGPYNRLQPILPSHVENSVKRQQLPNVDNQQFQLHSSSNFVPLYDRFEEQFSKNFNNYQIDADNNVDRHGLVDQTLGKPYEYDDYKASQTSYATGPHQVETIQSEHYHKKSKPFDISHFEHKSDEKHAEVHYHQHKHVHKHEHKQDHKHEHKQEHEHKHLHNQHHKHEHHQEHKHGHNHKHEHHQDHKHDHHAEHKHEHHQEHKHDHGHKHEHHQDHKHDHHHGHKHNHKHGHHHGHKHKHLQHH